VCVFGLCIVKLSLLAQQPSTIRQPIIVYIGKGGACLDEIHHLFPFQSARRFPVQFANSNILLLQRGARDLFFSFPLTWGALLIKSPSGFISFHPPSSPFLIRTRGSQSKTGGNGPGFMNQREWKTNKKISSYSTITRAGSSHTWVNFNVHRGWTGAYINERQQCARSRWLLLIRLSFCSFPPPFFFSSCNNPPIQHTLQQHSPPCVCVHYVNVVAPDSPCAFSISSVIVCIYLYRWVGGPNFNIRGEYIHTHFPRGSKLVFSITAEREGEEEKRGCVVIIEQREGGNNISGARSNGGCQKPALCLC
jgi:hypothetical protein